MSFFKKILQPTVYSRAINQYYVTIVILDYIILDLGYCHIMICDKLTFPGWKGCIAVK